MYRKNKIKRCVSFILSLIMVLGTLNMTVFSVETSADNIIPVGNPAEVVNNTYNDILLEETNLSQNNAFRNEESRNNNSESAIDNGAVYSFINVASGRYMTVHNGSTASGTNVYQYYDDDNEDYEVTLSQAFRLDYNEETEGYRIRAMCSDNGYGKVLEVPDFESATSAVSGSTSNNVRIFSYSEEYQDDQEWIIRSYNNTNRYVIALRGNTNFVMTACGTGNGSSSGNTSTSAGNIYVSQFTGASNQLWRLESGDAYLNNSINIKDAAAEGETYDCSEGSSTLSFCCPVTEFGQYVIWSSSNIYTAMISGSTVMARKAGETTVKAKLMNSSGTVAAEYSVKVYVTLEDGAYYLINENSWYRLQYADTSALYENAILETREIEEIDESERFAMFKIKHLGEGLYSIRSMLDNSKGWIRSGSNIVISTIGTSNTSLPNSAKWRILSNSNGYYIQHSSGTGYVLDANSDDDGKDVSLTAYSSTDTLQNWIFTEISGSYNGTTIYDYTGKIVIGDTYEFKAVFYSTYPDINGQNGITWYLAHNSDNAAEIDPTTGVLTGVSTGSYTVVAAYQPDSATLWQSWVRGVWTMPVPEGIFFIRNAKHTDGYLQIDDNATDLSANANIELHNFNANNDQIWHIIFLYNGHYKIFCHASFKALTAPDNVGGIVTQTDFESLNTQQWNISNTNGVYKFSPVSNPSAYLSAGTDFLNFDLRARLKNDQSDDKDEWYAIVPENSIQLEAQQQSDWCWAASARMASMVYMQSPISQESAAVYVKLNDKTMSPSQTQITKANKAATVSETAKTLEYILGSSNCYSKLHKIYSATTLRSLLDNSNPVIILRGWYDSSGKRSGGHFVVIYNYHFDSANGIYLYHIYDPDPVNLGSTYLRSYQNICNGRNSLLQGEADTGIWEGIVVFEKGDYLSTISWPGT